MAMPYKITELDGYLSWLYKSAKAPGINVREKKTLQKQIEITCNKPGRDVFEFAVQTGKKTVSDMENNNLMSKNNKYIIPLIFILLCTIFTNMYAQTELIPFEKESEFQNINVIVDSDAFIGMFDIKRKQTDSSDDSYGLTDINFNSKVTLIDFNFLHDVYMENVNFNDEVDCNYTSFLGELWTKNINFRKNAMFHQSLFEKDVQFYKFSFDSLVDFTETEFGKGVMFSGNFIRRSKFNATCSFFDACFNTSCSFNNCIFKKEVNFRANFGNDLSFEEVIFEDNVNFIEATLAKTTCINQCRFNGYVNLMNATLPEEFDFRNNSMIEYEIDFSNCVLSDSNKKCKIALAGSNIDKIKLNMNNFELWFPNENNEQILSIYENVLSKLKKDGFAGTDSYKNLDIEYRQFKYKISDNFWDSIENTAQRLWWNYGYDKFQIIVNTFIILFSFSIINLLVYKRLKSVYSIEFLKYDYCNNHNTFNNHKSYILRVLNCVGKSATYYFSILIYTSIIFFGLKISINNFSSNKIYKRHTYVGIYLLLFVEYITGLICVAYLINIIIVNQ